METECAFCEVRTGLWVLLKVASISQLTVSRLSRHCGILNISQHHRPPRPVIVISLILLLSLLLTSWFTLTASCRPELNPETSNLTNILQDHLDAWLTRHEASTTAGQHKRRLKAEAQLYLEWGLNPRFQCLNGHCFGPYTSLSLWLANCNIPQIY
jgi:hypothetical protein